MIFLSRTAKDQTAAQPSWWLPIIWNLEIS